jgi:hypothetical protein
MPLRTAFDIVFAWRAMKFTRPTTICSAWRKPSKALPGTAAELLALFGSQLAWPGVPARRKARRRGLLWFLSSANAPRRQWRGSASAT